MKKCYHWLFNILKETVPGATTAMTTHKSMRVPTKTRIAPIIFLLVDISSDIEKLGILKIVLSTQLVVVFYISFNFTVFIFRILGRLDSDAGEVNGNVEIYFILL